MTLVIQCMLSVLGTIEYFSIHCVLIYEWVLFYTYLKRKLASLNERSVSDALLFLHILLGKFHFVARWSVCS